MILQYFLNNFETGYQKDLFKIFSKQTMNSLNFVLIFRMFFLRLHFQSYGTVGIGEPMGIRVLSGRSLFRSFSYLLPLCNEDTGPVTPALIFSGCDTGVCRSANYFAARCRVPHRTP
ncbi:hypothetical protein Hanom_Chr08g00732151 [Helianthus anomalus]